MPPTVSAVRVFLLFWPQAVLAVDGERRKPWYESQI